MGLFVGFVVELLLRKKKYIKIYVINIRNENLKKIYFILFYFGYYFVIINIGLYLITLVTIFSLKI